MSPYEILTCIGVGFGIVITFAVLFWGMYWAMKRVREVFLDWDNPWRKIEEFMQSLN